MIKHATAAERRHLARIAAVPCVMCTYLGLGDTPAQVHHPRDGVGSGQRQSHWLGISLCPNHHQNAPDGLHHLGVKGFYERFKLDEWDLLAMTLKAIFNCSKNGR
jgi:Recombination enhancement, RecA-dependent nuclease